MKQLMSYLLVGTMLIFMMAPAQAQDDPCHPDGFRTQTQGGWGAVCNGNNAGCIRDANWDAAFPAGLVIGGTYTVTFTSSNAVAVFLATGGMPDVLTQDYVDPVGNTEAGVFAGQVTALAISLGMSNAGVPGFGPLGSLYYLSTIPFGGNPFVGMTVNELFAMANDVLGGNLGALPPGTTVSDLNDVITDINENFVDGVQNNGNLVSNNCDEPLPVELLDFNAIPGESSITLEWTTASELSVDFYSVERKTSGNWQAIARVEGLGDNLTGHEYRYVDNTVEAGTIYSYRLVSQDFDGSRTVFTYAASAAAHGSAATADEFELLQNYPNPFNPATTIAFSLPEASDVSLVVYDMLGRQVATLANGSMNAGAYSVEFDGASLAAGAYFYRLTAGDFTDVKKLMLVK